MTILLTPARIGGVEIKNRIVMPPMTTRLADDEGHVTDDTIAYYMARVRGGVGLITVEMASPERAGRHRRRELGIYDDRFLPGLTRLVDAIHGGGAKASIQLGHGGGHTRRDICGETPVAPSAIPHPVYEVTNETIVPEAMTRERIAETVAAFARAGGARQGGGLRLRRDPRRARLPDLAIRHAVREPAHRRVRRLARKPRALRPRGAARGEGGGRNDAGDLSPVGRRLLSRTASVADEGTQVAVWAAEAGADALHIAAGHYRSLPSGERMIPPMAYPDATFLDYAAAVKKRVSVPVIAVGRLGDPEHADGGGRQRQGRFRRARPHADRRSGLGREACARRAGAALPRLQHLRQRDARRRAAALRGQRRGRAGAAFRVARGRRSNERIAVIGAGPAGTDLCVAGRGAQCGDGVRARRRARRRVPLCRQGAAVPGGRRQPGIRSIATCAAS